MTTNDINQAIKRIAETGKIEIGATTTKKQTLTGNTKLIIMSKNCPTKIKKDLQTYAKLSETPTLTYPGTSLELGELLGKPFLISSISITNAGDVNIKQLLTE